jgi:hypothetical protein
MLAGRILWCSGGVGKGGERRQCGDGMVSQAVHGSDVRRR